MSIKAKGKSKTKAATRTSAIVMTPDIPTRVEALERTIAKRRDLSVFDNNSGAKQ